MKTKLLLLIVAFTSLTVQAQFCPSAQGDETTYGTNNVWIGYVYDNMNFTNYVGYVNEGNAGSPSFDQSFGGDNVSYASNGCATQTETFSIRYKLQKTFADGDYEFLVGADDGFRLSINGGSTWIINRWADQAYTTDLTSIHLNGTYDLVLEFYENGGQNRISFNVQATCLGTGNPATYGTGNVWRGYVYDGTNFNTFKGTVTEGSVGDMNFDQNFGGDYVNYPTSDCSILTETFSVRYRLRHYFPQMQALFVVGADDGYRLSLDGGVTWVIDRWWDQGYNTTSANVVLNGYTNMVLEFYENGGGNRVSFNFTVTLLPIQLLSFTATSKTAGNELNWKVSAESNPEHFEIEKSKNGTSFSAIGNVPGKTATNGLSTDYSFVDANAGSGTSYYRLKMLDKDGKTSYSKIIALTASGKDELDLYPTVTDQRRTVYIRSTSDLQKVSLAVYDMSGKKVVGQIIPSVSTGQAIPIALPQGQVTKGTYFVQLRSTDKLLLSKKIIVQ